MFPNVSAIPTAPPLEGRMNELLPRRLWTSACLLTGQIYEENGIDIKTGPGEGHRLKAHDTNPNLPLSPIFVSLRT